MSNVDRPRTDLVIRLRHGGRIDMPDVSAVDHAELDAAVDGRFNKQTVTVNQARPDRAGTRKWWQVRIGDVVAVEATVTQ